VIAQASRTLSGDRSKGKTPLLYYGICSIGLLTFVRYHTNVSPEERLRQLCNAIVGERDLNKLRSLLRQLEFTLAEYSLDLQNRAIFLSHPDSHQKRAS